MDAEHLEEGSETCKEEENSVKTDNKFLLWTETQIKNRNSSLKFCFNGLFFAFSGVESTQIVRNLRTGFSGCTLTYSS